MTVPDARPPTEDATLTEHEQDALCDVISGRTSVDAISVEQLYRVVGRIVAARLAAEREHGAREAVSKVRVLLDKWRAERADYPLDDARASQAFIVVKMCEDELRAVLPPEVLPPETD